ncbi:uncharacterized protein LOC133203712 [Saccostrea echinata]|uniref:uncharacterized protein LOC133203712 n=1 Tax=Saccostrea echinata TaxID=191078 RepID=UPI002A7F8A19|nr:uncharacterized protein LOC133203712 [Saccostrea echinata]
MSDLNTYAIVGLCVGGVLLVVIIVVLAVLKNLRNKKKQTQRMFMIDTMLNGISNTNSMFQQQGMSTIPGYAPPLTSPMYPYQLGQTPQHLNPDNISPVQFGQAQPTSIYNNF